MPESTHQDSTALSSESWRLLSEVIFTGTCTLKSGRELKFDEDGILKVVQWCASLQKRRAKLLPSLDDFKIAETKGGTSSGKDKVSG